MELETIQIDQLSNDPGNVRRHSERNVVAVMGSLRRFGQQTPIVADASNVVRVGNCRLEAMRRLGWTEVQIVRTTLSGADAAAYSIADNRTGDPDIGSQFDDEALSAVLRSLRAEDETLVADAGYSLEELANILTEQAGPNDQPPGDFPVVDENLATDHECPRCKFRWSGSSSAAESVA